MLILTYSDKLHFDKIMRNIKILNDNLLKSSVKI